MKVVCDIETDALENPQHIWCVVCLEYGTENYTVFREGDRDKFVEYSKKVDTWIGHNFISFDLHVLNTLWGANIDPSSVVDTLVVGRVIKYSLPGGHSLENWGRIFSYEKSLFDDFSKWSQLLEDRCKTDVEINAKAYGRYAQYIENPEWRAVFRVEHDTALAMAKMQRDGFYFDKSAADELYGRATAKLKALEEGMDEVFPPRASLVREVNPRVTKHGTLHRQDFRWLGSGDVDLRGFAPGCPFSVIRWDSFNPGSPSQVVERLDGFGWKPTEKTKSGNSYRVSETNLATLPDLSLIHI